MATYHWQQLFQTHAKSHGLELAMTAMNPPKTLLFCTWIHYPPIPILKPKILNAFNQAYHNISELYRN